MQLDVLINDYHPIDTQNMYIFRRSLSFSQ